ncbi:Hypothetical_protein [Hexamita inflata]|uniref:Hypothetical_protein n=1 Tax=Hexamita inflata TaxID=28002 RepID=A0AA86UPZ7_9EUKA|nr:Hypothetical protein HINF_LOCUS47807 [Hexamita inflata]
MTFIWLITSVLWLERMAQFPPPGCNLDLDVGEGALGLEEVARRRWALSWTSMKAFEMALAVEDVAAREVRAGNAVGYGCDVKAGCKDWLAAYQCNQLIWPSVTVMFKQILETVSFWTGQDTAKLAQFCCFTALRQLSWYGIEPCTMNVDVLYPTEMAPLFEHDTFIEYTLLLRILDWIPLYHPTKPPTYELVDTMLLLVMVPSEMTTDDWLFIQPTNPPQQPPTDPTVLFCTWTMDSTITRQEETQPMNPDEE